MRLADEGLYTGRRRRTGEVAFRRASKPAIFPSRRDATRRRRETPTTATTATIKFVREFEIAGTERWVGNKVYAAVECVRVAPYEPFSGFAASGAEGTEE